MSQQSLQELYNRATRAMQNAYNPYSNYAVGSAILTESGEMYAGCNVENVSYGMTICAEANAVGTMVASQGRVRIAQVVLVASGGTFPSPCGACRQKLGEFATPETMVHFARARDEGEGFDVRSYRMSTLLPLSFTQAVLWERKNTDVPAKAGISASGSPIELGTSGAGEDTRHSRLERESMPKNESPRSQGQKQ